jgi:hypothetical protein
MTNAANENKAGGEARCQQSRQFPPRLSAISYILVRIDGKSLHPNSSGLGQPAAPAEELDRRTLRTHGGLFQSGFRPVSEKRTYQPMSSLFGPPEEDLKSWRIIGRTGTRRATTLKPARAKVEA